MCLCWIPLPAYCVPRLWSLCFRSRLTWICWHKPEAIFSEQVWERKPLENISSLDALTLPPLILSLSLCLPSFFPPHSPPEARLRKYSNDERRWSFFPSLLPHIHHLAVLVSCLHGRGLGTSQRKRRVLWWCNPTPFSSSFSLPYPNSLNTEKSIPFLKPPPNSPFGLCWVILHCFQRSPPTHATGSSNIWRQSLPTAIDSHWYDTGVNSVICVVIKKRRRSKAQWQEAAVGLAVFWLFFFKYNLSRCSAKVMGKQQHHVSLGRVLMQHFWCRHRKELVLERFHGENNRVLNRWCN